MMIGLWASRLSAQSQGRAQKSVLGSGRNRFSIDLTSRAYRWHMNESWFRGIWQTVSGARKTAGQDFVVKRLTAPHGIADPPRKLTKDDEYISIKLPASRIVNVRKWTGKFYGAVHARSSYLHQDRGLIEYQTVLS